MSSKYQGIWNQRIREAGSRKAGRFSGKTMETLAREGGDFWIYEQSPHNTDAYREGWDRIFGKKGKANDSI